MRRTLPANWLAEREAAILAHFSTPEMIAHREQHIDWMRRCNAASAADARRFAIGTEMDGRTFSEHEIAGQERYLAECRAYAAQQQQVAA